ncbi:MAG: SDR family NAD(P)-dependent oxidoreductase [Bacteroidales bacterium]|nr:SDR family NAD(P)-dependent oxidoreductase [Bacteroidales bacterium]MBR2135752.1 SDR family NAD(P)-dependent oxidoreductase [Bacteroidales bacterium]
MKRAVIMGATSGMGMAVSRILAEKGWRLGIAGRREEKLKELQALFPDRISYQVIDIEKDDAPVNLQVLIEKIGGMDLYFHGSGVGWHNEELDLSTELKTVSTNALGFTRMVDSAWHYFCQRGGGHIAVISSIAGVKGLGPAPSYSATKGFDNTYIQALAQLSHKKHLGIIFTDIRPGFVDTPLLDTSKHHYPMLMQPQKVSRMIVRAIEKKKRVAVIDWRYRVLVFFWRLLPNWIWERIRL